MGGGAHIDHLRGHQDHVRIFFVVFKLTLISHLLSYISSLLISYLEHWFFAEWDGVGLVPVTGKILRQSLRLFLGTQGEKRH